MPLQYINPKGLPVPQTYSQVGLILSAMRLSRSWEEGLWHAS